MQTDFGFELKLVRLSTTFENTVILGRWISIKEQQKLFVEKPEHEPENTNLTLSHTGTFNALGAPSKAQESEWADPDCQL